MQRPDKFSVFSWQYLLFVVSAILVVLFSWAYYNYNHHSFNALRLQNALHQKSREAQSYTSLVKSNLYENEEWHAVDVTNSFKPQGVDILVYKNDSLCSWSNQVLPYKNEDKSLLNKRVTKLANTWYIIDEMVYQQWDIFTLVNIKTEYPFNNAFLSDEYSIKLPLSLCYDIMVDENLKGVHVNDLEGNYLFTAKDCASTNPLYANWGTFFVFISILLYIQVIIYTIRFHQTTIKSLFCFVGSLLVSALLYYVHISFQFPSVVYSVPLFSPLYFGASELFPNLGSLLIFSIILFSESYIFYKYLLFPKIITQLPTLKIVRYIIIAFCIIGSYCFWYFQNHIVTLLISNSASASLLFRITDIGRYDIVRIFILSLLWLSVVLVLEKITTIFLSQVGKKKLSITVFITIIILSLISFTSIHIISSLTFLVIVFMLIWVTRRKSSHAYTTFIWFIFVFSFYAVFSFYYHNSNREIEERELLVENLSFRLIQEEDPLTEMLLKEDEKFMAHDTVLKEKLLIDHIDIKDISKYIDGKFLQGYLQRYDLQVIPCWPGGDVYLSDEGSNQNCYDYFDRMLLQNGTHVMGSENWYFLKNKTGGEITYFGVFKFFKGDVQKETCLFVELVAKPFFEGPGYPELLLSEREGKLREPLINYSYG